MPSMATVFLSFFLQKFLKIVFLYEKHKTSSVMFGLCLFVYTVINEIETKSQKIKIFTE